MTTPMVTIIWLNYNSMGIIDLVLESLNSIAELDYPNDKYELVMVDNGSTDGSFEKIKKLLENRKSLRKKIVRLSRNLGFTGGNNIGFKARDRDSKYVVLLNNDAVPFKESLKVMVEYAEQYDVGGLNGILLKYGSKNIIDAAGGIVDEVLNTYTIGTGNVVPWFIRRPFYVTYADGAYALIRVNCVLKSVGDRLFFDEFFGYGDDNVLGLILWNNGYKIISIPEVVAIHRRGSTFKELKERSLYFGIRSRVALSRVTNTRYKHVIPVHAFRSAVHGVLKAKSLSSYCARAVYDGFVLGKLLRNKYGLFIDIYKAPILKVSPGELTRFYLFGIRRLLRLYEEKVTKLIKKWEVK